MLLRWLLARIACGGILLMLGAPPLGALELITEAEAKLPSDTSQVRGLSRGPIIIPISPGLGAGVIRSPFNWKVQFESYGGARIDPDRVVITYKKFPAIDLTQRVKAFIKADGISVEGVEVPSGEHHIRVDIIDSGGRKGWNEFTIRVSQ